MRRKSLLFRFTEMEVEQLDQLVDALKWRDTQDGAELMGSRRNRSSAVRIAVASLLGEFVTERRKWDELQTPTPTRSKKK